MAAGFLSDLAQVGVEQMCDDFRSLLEQEVDWFAAERGLAKVRDDDLLDGAALQLVFLRARFGDVLEDADQLRAAAARHDASALVERADGAVRREDA
ncbi:MAG: hypothetical protein ACLGH0_06035, partial [Thermoanaerobaculia bacterium]